jgi:hypothetical protein
VPKLIGQGEDIYGNGIGISRFVIGKWIILPLGSLFLFILNVIIKRKSIKELVLHFVFVLLVFADYFIMGGKLSGHYGFVSGFVMMCQLLFFLTTTRFLGKYLMYFLIPTILIGSMVNIKYNIDYLNSTKNFRSEISDLREKIDSFKAADVVIIVRSLAEYEAVSSTTSFARSPKTNFFLQIEGKFEENVLTDDLLNAELYGNKIWHISPREFRKKTDKCIEVYFSKATQEKTCTTAVFISWLG